MSDKWIRTNPAKSLICRVCTGFDQDIGLAYAAGWMGAISAATMVSSGTKIHMKLFDLRRNIHFSFISKLCLYTYRVDKGCSE